MKYYIDELDIKSINFNNLKNNLYYEDKSKNIILSDNGYYTIYNNQYYRHYIDTIQSTSDDCYIKINNYLEKYTMYIDNNKWNKKKVDRIPNNHKNITIREEIYKLNEKCNVSLIIEKTEKGEICDVYFLSQLNDNDFSFQETMSYLLSKLI
jgi:hypothetical protein